MALADPAASVRDRTSLVTRDTQEHPLRCERVQRQPCSKELQGVSHGCIGVPGVGGPGMHTHTCVHTLARAHTPPRQEANSLPHPTCQIKPRVGAQGAWGCGGWWRGGHLLTLIFI